MKGQALHILFPVVLLLLIDLYVLNGLRGVSKKRLFLQKKSFRLLYWIVSAALIAGLIFVVYVKMGLVVRLAFVMLFFLVFIFKVSYIPFLVIDDIRRLFISIKNRASRKLGSADTVSGTMGADPEPSSAPVKANSIPRSEFLMKAGLLAGAIPLATIKLSMKNGLYDYHVIRKKLYFPNLPKAFDGIKLGQISDIHSGSFFNKTAVLGGVEMLMREKADLIFFTGDLVNAVSHEVKHYFDIFNKVKAPLGVYSCLGNHDYGDYAWFPNAEAKRKNLDVLITTHKNLGWDLLMNEHRRLKVDGEEIGILGIENWGELSRFPKYGRMDLAVKNTDDLPVKLLLSHDPSHWRAQVLPEYPQIDAMFSGHTHGMQMGVRTEHFQWSPIEYIYNEWAGHYHQGPQQLYVNVGYGFLAFYGRVGILPEITIFELKAGTDPSKSKTG
jgi:predicted MPP superfamily phosphohydrolase